MAALTTRQRDILRILLEASDPLSAAEIASKMNISPRQVTYSLTGIKSWLTEKNIKLKATPGVGLKIDLSHEQINSLQEEFNSKSSIQLILSLGRQQMIALLLLSRSDDPILLQRLQNLMQVARATVLKDLDIIESWFTEWQISLIRKPNFGIMVTAREQVLQQCIAALLWAESPFSDPIVEMTYVDGPVFTLKDEAGLLPILWTTEAEEVLIEKMWDPSN